MLIDFNSLYVQVFFWGGLQNIEGFVIFSLNYKNCLGVESAINRNYQFAKILYILGGCILSCTRGVVSPRNRIIYLTICPKLGTFVFDALNTFRLVSISSVGTFNLRINAKSLYLNYPFRVQLRCITSNED